MVKYKRTKARLWSTVSDEARYNKIDTERYCYVDIAKSLINECKVCTQLDELNRYARPLYDGKLKNYITDSRILSDKGTMKAFQDDLQAAFDLSKVSYKRLRDLYVILDNSEIANHVDNYSEFMRRLDKNSLIKSRSDLYNFKNNLNLNPKLSVKEKREILTKRLLDKLEDYAQNGGNMNILRESSTFASNFDSDMAAIKGVVNEKDKNNPHASQYADIWNRTKRVFKHANINVKPLNDNLNDAIEPDDKYNEVILKGSRVFAKNEATSGFDRFRYGYRSLMNEYEALRDGNATFAGQKLDPDMKYKKLGVFNDLQRDLINIKGEEEQLKLKRKQLTINSIQRSFGSVFGTGMISIDDFKQSLEELKAHHELDKEKDNLKMKKNLLLDRAFEEGFFEEFADPKVVSWAKFLNGSSAVITLLSNTFAKKVPLEAISNSIEMDVPHTAEGAASQVEMSM